MKTRRQGDVLVVEIEGVDTRKLAPIPREGGDTVLAHGEATGHRHRFRKPSTSMYALWPEQAPPSERIKHARELLARLPEIDAGAVPVGVLELAEPDVLVHEEHDPIEHDARQYLVLRQREYAPGELRVVAD